MFNKDKINNIIQFVINYLLMPFVFIFILIMCIIIFATTSHAADAQDYFPMYQNHNNKFSDTLKTNIANQFDSTNNYVFVYYDQYNPNSGYGRHYFYYIKFPKTSSGMMYGEKNSNLYQWSIYFIGSVNYTQGGFYTDARYPNTINGVTSSHNSAQWFMNMPSSNYNSNKDYVSNFQIYTDNTSAKQIVLLYDDGVSIPDGDTARDDMEKPDISNYIPDWTTPPSFDNSSVDSALESVYNIISWIGSNVKDSIKGSSQYVVDSLMWGFQRVLDTIRNKIDEVKTTINNGFNGVVAIIDNIKGTINNIKTVIDYIGEPIDTTAISSAINQNGLVSVKNDFIDFFNDFDDLIRNTSEPETFDITINVQNVRTFYNFGVRSPVVLHLGNNLNGTLKTAFRAFLWVLVIVGSIFLTEKNLSAWIKGGGFSDK